MSPQEEAARRRALETLRESRAQLRRLLDPPPSAGRDGAPAAAGSAEFPRSRTMRLLMSERGLSFAGALLAGLLLARPALAIRLLRLLPVGGISSALLLRKALAAFWGQRRRDPRP